MLNQSCIALVAINLSTSMNCQCEYNFPYVKNLSSLHSWIRLILVIFVSDSLTGRLFAKQVVQTLQIGHGGLLFTGDQTGLPRVYTWLAD